MIWGLKGDVKSWIGLKFSGKEEEKGQKFYKLLVHKLLTSCLGIRSCIIETLIKISCATDSAIIDEQDDLSGL